MLQPKTVDQTLISLNGENISRKYTAEIAVKTKEKDKESYTCVALVFSVRLIKVNKDDTLEYHFKVNKRLFLDKKNRPVFKLSKAQKIALSVAKINDDLIMNVSKDYDFIGIKNTKKVITHWKKIKANLLEAFPDLNIVIADFDWQMKEENIQNVFKNDNFYSFFFSKFFHQEFPTEGGLERKKLIANGINNLDVPIIEERNITKKDRLFQNITIATKAKLDFKNDRFPKEKMNVFLGYLAGKKGVKNDLKFTYNGDYKVRPRLGIINKGQLKYTFEIPELYQKTTAINFNLEADE